MILSKYRSVSGESLFDFAGLVTIKLTWGQFSLISKQTQNLNKKSFIATSRNWNFRLEFWIHFFYLNLGLWFGWNGISAYYWKKWIKTKQSGIIIQHILCIFSYIPDGNEILCAWIFLVWSALLSLCWLRFLYFLFFKNIKILNKINLICSEYFRDKNSIFSLKKYDLLIFIFDLVFKDFAF